MDFTYSMQVPFGNVSGVKLTQTNQLDVVIFFKNQNARVKCLFSHPIVFIINPLRLQDTLFGVLRKIATARSISVRFSSNFHQMFASACEIW
jgi:glutaredoxin-related protein